MPDVQVNQHVATSPQASKTTPQLSANPHEGGAQGAAHVP
jgi:hypothetical protein